MKRNLGTLPKNHIRKEIFFFFVGKRKISHFHERKEDYCWKMNYPLDSSLYRESDGTQKKNERNSASYSI
jgi:hypothetical protein